MLYSNVLTLFHDNASHFCRRLFLIAVEVHCRLIERLLLVEEIPIAQFFFTRERSSHVLFS